MKKTFAVIISLILICSSADKALATGTGNHAFTVQQAITAANGHFYLPLTGIQNSKIYGNSQVRIVDEEAKKSISQEAEEKTAGREMNIPTEIDCGMITNDLKKKGIDLTGFEVRLYNNSPGNGTVEFIYVVGEVETSSRIIVAIENGKIKEWFDYRHYLTADEIEHLKKVDLVTSDYMMKKSMEKCWENTVDSGNRPIKQEQLLYYDCEEKQVYLLVATDYYYGTTETLGRDLEMIPWDKIISQEENGGRGQIEKGRLQGLALEPSF